MNTFRYAFTGSILIMCLAATVTAQEKKLQPKDVPAAVTAAAAKAYPNAKITAWVKETEDGKTLFEASMTEGQKKQDVVFTPDGKIDAVEEIVPSADVPAAVQKALKAKYPQAVVETAERITRG